MRAVRRRGPVRLRWQREPQAENGAVEPLAVGAAASLGESFRETYWAWYNLSARAAIGNAAYAAGAAATARASESEREAADAPLLGAAVEELELDDEMVAEAIAALDGGDGAPGRGDDADEDAGDHRGASQEV